jgi:hypothetical protein
MKLFLTIAIAILQAFIVIIPLKGKLSDNRRKFPYNFTWKGYFLITSCILTIICTVFVLLMADKDEELSRINLTSQLRVRDSIYQNQIREAATKYEDKLDRSDKNIIELLAKYGLRYDSAQKAIAKLVKDSSTKKITIIQENNPTISLCIDKGIKVLKNQNDSLQLQFWFCYTHSPANISFDLRTLIVSNGKWEEVGNRINLVNRKESLDIDGSLEGNRLFISNSPYSKFYFYLIGNYTNKNGTQSFRHNDAFVYDVNGEDLRLVKDNIISEIEKFLKIK